VNKPAYMRRQFLDCLGKGEEFNFRTFDDTPAKRGALVSQHRGMIATVERKLELINKKHAGIFVMPNDGGQTDRSINRIRCCFVDMDSEDAVTNVDKAIAKNPHIVIQSSFGRFHAYWKVTGFKLQNEGVRCPEFRQVQKNLIYHLGGDPCVKNESRVMRMPGYYHCKCKDGGPVFLTSIVRVSNHPAFSYEEMTSMFPPEPVKQWSMPKLRKGGDTSDFKGQYGTGEGGRNHHIFKRCCGAFARGLDEARVWNEALLENAACSPPLDERELQSIFRQALAYRR